METKEKIQFTKTYLKKKTDPRLKNHWFQKTKIPAMNLSEFVFFQEELKDKVKIKMAARVFLALPKRNFLNNKFI